MNKNYKITYITMYKPEKLVFIFFKSPFFVGSLGSKDAIVDLTIHRDVITSLPIYPASGFKGTLRSYATLLLKSS